MIPPCGALIKASKCRKTQEECIWFDACKNQNRIYANILRDQRSLQVELARRCRCP